MVFKYCKRLYSSCSGLDDAAITADHFHRHQHPLWYPWKDLVTAVVDSFIRAQFMGVRLKRDYLNTIPAKNRHLPSLLWQKSTKVSLFYLVYRWCVAVQFITVLLCSIFDSKRYGKIDSINWKWLIFLTNWVYTMCTAQSLISLWIVQRAWIKKPKDKSENIPGHYRLYWVLHSIAMNGAISITFIYWFVVFDPALHRMDLMNFLVHAGNAIVMLLDACIVRHFSRLVHGLYAAVVGMSYGVFTLAYYSGGGTGRDGFPYIYKALDWRDPPRAAIFTVLCTLFLIGVHVITWTICKARQWLAQCLGCGEKPAKPRLQTDAVADSAA